MPLKFAAGSSQVQLQSHCVAIAGERRHALAMLKPTPYRPIYLRHWREHRGLTQAELAELTDMSEANVSSIENGNSNWTRKTLHKFAVALECDPLDILTRAPAESENVFTLWAKASPAQRRQFDRLASALLKDGD